MKRLNGRELEIIRHTECGYTAKEIAKMIGIEPRTVQCHVESIRRKLVCAQYLTCGLSRQPRSHAG